MKRFGLLLLAALVCLAVTGCPDPGGGDDVTFTVTFDADDGTPTPPPVTVSEGGTLGSLPAVTKEGYNFLGWYDGNTKYEANTVITKDVTLKAKWEQVDNSKWTVTFDADGGAPTPSPIQVTKGQSAGTTAWPEDPEKHGFVFKGWFDNTEEYKSDTTITKNVTVKAKWIAETESGDTLNIPNTTLYDGKISVVPATYDTLASYEGKSNVLRAVNDPQTNPSLNLFLNIPETAFGNETTLNVYISMSGSLRRDSAGTFLWQDPQASYGAFTNLGYGDQTANTWLSFSVVDKSITVTKGTPYRLQVSYGSDENKDFTFYLADFQISAKIGSITYDTLADFEGTAPTLTAIGSATSEVVDLSTVSEFIPSITSGKALKVVCTNYNQGVTFPVTLPADLSGYSKLVFDGAIVAGSDGTYKKVRGLIARAITQWGDGSSTGFYGDSGKSIESNDNVSTSLNTSFVIGEIEIDSFTEDYELSGAVVLGIGVATNAGATLIIDNIRLSKPAFTDLSGVTYTPPAQ
jgi:uncharacterized repeat protein (TIGR02543 family)